MIYVYERVIFPSNGRVRHSGKTNRLNIWLGVKNKFYSQVKRRNILKQIRYEAKGQNIIKCVFLNILIGFDWYALYLEHI